MAYHTCRALVIFAFGGVIREKVFLPKLLLKKKELL